ncbi:hypothetical protein LA733_0326 [Leptospira interrogans]|nr:hypothetical protein LA733_0326 [Leptospira interrogans]KWV29026.1 hypothetical protein LA702_0315 [Leptospira interrogans]
MEFFNNSNFVFSIYLYCTAYNLKMWELPRVTILRTNSKIVETRNSLLLENSFSFLRPNLCF